MEKLQSEKQKFSFIPNFLLRGDNRNLFIDWLSGLSGGFVSATVCAPLDLARTRHMLLATTNSYGVVSYHGFLQTCRTIVESEGIRGLYRGYNVTAVSIPLFHSLYFTIFYKLKRTLNEKKWISESQRLLTNVTASILTGFICDTVTCPLWVIRTRLQTQYLHKENIQKYTGMIDGLSKMAKEEGFRSFYKGLFASYIGLAHAAILYPLYEHLRRKLTEWKGQPSNIDIFFVSLFSKFVAMVITYPHVVIRARQQDQRTPLHIENKDGVKQKSNQATSIIGMINQTVKREGFKGLYSGLRIDLIRVLPANAITFVTFEYVKRNLQEKLPKV